MKVKCCRCSTIIDETEYMQFNGLCADCMKKSAKKEKNMETNFNFMLPIAESADKNH